MAKAGNALVMNPCSYDPCVPPSPTPTKQPGSPGQQTAPPSPTKTASPSPTKTATASPTKSPTKAPTATVSVGPGQQQQLPTTGPDVGMFVGLALLIALAGVIVFVLTRRRHHNADHSTRDR